ncbi:MAG: hypothetical protein KKC80_06835 [Candidatus Margulisbacteria bacterium]|nr:hypothetical protein [Candidatus Margulisiibacteriota bacterium]MBU1617520.1 hypothetical protein [Candidatus Margulisiibacteriota bacterium]
MNLLKSHLIKAGWFFLLSVYCLTYFIFVRPAGAFLAVLFTVIFAAGLLVLVFLTARAVYFRRQLNNFLRRILANDYQTGLKESLWLGDEVTELAVLANKMIGQLRTYDQLRVDRIGQFNRLVDLISENVAEGIILIDVERKLLMLNSAVQKLFGVEQGKITFDAIEKQEHNEQFLPLFKELVDNGKVIETCTVDLHLPIKNASRRVCLKMQPLKDQAEKVRLAVIFVSPAG